MTPASMTRPVCTVIVPAHNAEGVLPRALDALAASDLARERWELIVVDDASTDTTAAIAARYADTTIRIPGRAHGPAYARNRGAEVARGDVLLFFDSDVVVGRDTVRKFVQLFAGDPTLAAAFGSYDDRPPAPGFMSQYRNLLHHFVHQQNAGEVPSFWAGAGAVRRAVFEEAGMFDEWHFARPQIEDIELGARLAAMGKRTRLCSDIQVTHLKQWTLRNVMRTDLRDRGIPWARMLAHSGGLIKVGTLNLKWTEKLNVALTWVTVLLLVAALLLSMPLLAWLALACVAFIVITNWRLWQFFARVRGVLFAIRAIPAHLLYYLMNGVSFGVGLILQQAFGAPLPDPTIEAWHEVGLKRWPPIPSKQRRSTWTAGSE